MMKKFFEFFGVKLHATSSEIRGRKSSGKEDYAGYKNWRALDGKSD